MNWKIVFIGGIAYYVAMFVVSFATGYLIHSPEGVLFETYKATAEFWRPELNADPPDMGALMPMWIATGLLGALIAAGIGTRPCGSSPGRRRLAARPQVRRDRGALRAHRRARLPGRVQPA